MYIERYSATGVFGVPIDNPAQLRDFIGIKKLMGHYGIEAQAVPTDPTDITPYYWRKPAFRYYASLAHPEGPAVVDLQPAFDDSEHYDLSLARNPTAPRTGIRRIELPSDQEALIIGGPSPRFGALICVHEFIVCNNESVR